MKSFTGWVATAIAMIVKGGKVTVVVAVDGVVEQRGEKRRARKDSTRMRQSRPVWRRSRTTAEASMHMPKASHGESEIQR